MKNWLLARISFHSGNQLVPYVPSWFVWSCTYMLYFYRLGSHSRCTVSMTFGIFVWSYVPVWLIDFMRFKFFLGSTRGGTLWRKHLSSVPWVCLATWQIQRQWNLWILWMLNQKVRVHSLSGTVLFSCISRVAVRRLTERYTCLYFLYRSWHGVSSLPLPRWLVVQILCWPLLRS